MPTAGKRPVSKPHRRHPCRRAISWFNEVKVETIINYSDPRHSRVLDAEGYLYNLRGERIYELKENGDLTAYRYDAAGELTKVYYPLYSKKPIEDLKERRYFGLGLDLETLNSFKAGVPQYSGTEVDDLAAEISAVADPLANGIYYSTPVTDTKVKKYWDGSVESGQAPPPRVEGLAPGEKPLPAASSLDLGDKSTDLASLYQKITNKRLNLDRATHYWAEEFTYDPNGNVQLKRNGWGEISYRYNAANQLTQVGKRFYQYDRNGNLIREALGDGFADYRYNYENRLINVNNRFRDLLSDQSFTGEVNYQYDALGRKVSKELLPAEGSKKEREYYLYNGLGTDILTEYQNETGSGFSRGRNTSQVREYYYGNGMLLAQKLYLPDGIGDPQHRLSWTNATMDLICYSQDALGSVTLITGQGGKVLGKYRYDAFGNAYNGRFEGCVFGEDEFDNFWDWDNDESVTANSTMSTGGGVTAQSWDGPGNGNGYAWGHYKHGRSWGILRQGNVYGFAGERFEPELGVYSFTFRDYNPRTMRWMTVDPIKDGVNWYLYCNGNPVNYIDPLGLYTGYGHSTLTRAAFEAVGITDKENINDAVRGNVDTDKHDEDYDWTEHFDSNFILPGDSRDNNKEEELEKAVESWETWKLVDQLDGVVPSEVADKIKEDAYEHLGNGLHSIEDKYAHNYEDDIGPIHWAKKEVDKILDTQNFDPDNPMTDKKAFYGAYKESCEYLDEFLRETGQGSIYNPNDLPIENQEELYKLHRENIEKSTNDPCNHY